MSRVLIWDLPTRILHWIMAGAFLAALLIASISDDESTLFPYHMMIGILLGAAVILRIFWGVVGSRHARFASFTFSPSALFSYLRGAFSGSPLRWPGHNPGSAYAGYAMFVLIGIITVTGILMTRGIEAGEELHEVAAWVMLAVVGVHLAGVLWHTVRHRENISVSMISGRKEAEGEAAIRSSLVPVGVLFLAILSAFGFGLIRNYDAVQRQTRVPLVGWTIQLTGEDEGNEGNHHGDREDDEDDDD